MSFVLITVNRSGVVSLDVLVERRADYDDAVELHYQIAPAIRALHRAIKEKFAEDGDKPLDVEGNYHGEDSSEDS